MEPCRREPLLFAWPPLGRVTARDVLDRAGLGIGGVRAVLQYFADGRQRYWPLGWDDEFIAEAGDAFEVEYGPPVLLRGGRPGNG